MISKINQSNNHLYIIIAFLLLLLFIIICYLVYSFVNLITNEKVIIKTVEKECECPLPVINMKNNQNNNDLIIHPNKLPEYNNQDYQQIGILTANETDKEPIVLPLLAKRVNNNRDRWNYYTATDKNNMMRIPIKHRNIDCDDNIGCIEINDGDNLNIEIYKGRVFTATIYKKQSPQYFAEIY